MVAALPLAQVFPLPDEEKPLTPSFFKSVRRAAKVPEPGIPDPEMAKVVGRLRAGIQLINGYLRPECQIALSFLSLNDTDVCLRLSCGREKSSHKNTKYLVVEKGFEPIFRFVDACGNGEMGRTSWQTPRTTYLGNAALVLKAWCQREGWLRPDVTFPEVPKTPRPGWF